MQAASGFIRASSALHMYLGMYDSISHQNTIAISSSIQDY
jgi:hypothetical protein